MVTTLSQTVFFNDLTPARLLATDNIAGTYYNGISDNGVGATLTVNATSLTIDGVAVNVGDRVLLSAQNNQAQNGVYFVSLIDATVVLTRAFDQQCVGQFKAGQFIFIGAGNSSAGKSLCLIEPVPQHIGTDAITYSSTSSGGGGVLLPVTPNYIPIFAETNGTISMSDGTIRTNFSIIADPGIGFIAQSPTPLNGSIGLFAQDAGGNYNLYINNETMTQSTAMVVPNVVNSHGKFLVAAGETPFVDKHLAIATGTLGVMLDSGAQLLTGNTGVFNGGSTNNAFAITGMTSTSVGVCVIKQSTNPVSIVKAIASAGFVTVTFSGDPGAGTILNYVYTTNPLA